MLDLIPLLAQAGDHAAAVAPAGKTLAAGIPLAVAGAGAAIGVGLVGSKAAEAVGRNPGAFDKVLTISIIGMALAEAIAIYALVAFFLS